MKKRIVILALVVILPGLTLLFILGPFTQKVNVSVYGESDTGYSWVRTYRGAERGVQDFVSALETSYIRLAESMDAGSVVKVFVDGVLMSESTYRGQAKAPFSGIQISVHDQFAFQHQFRTSDALPGFLSDMDIAREPFVCGSGQ